MLPLSALEVAADGLDHPEGVTVDANDTVWAGGQSGQIYEIDLEARTKREVLSTGGAMLGLCFDGHGDVFACNVNFRAVVRVRPSTGEWHTVSTGCPERAFVCPNYPVFDDSGNLYVTVSGTVDQDDGWIARITPDGVTELWSDECVAFPNGAALAHDGRSLLVLESTTPALVRIPISAHGRAGPREVVAKLDGTAPDGLVALEDGGALVCCYRPDRVLYVDSEGQVETLLDDPRGIYLNSPTNGVLAGPDRRTLVLASLGAFTLKQVEVPYRGSALRYPLVSPSAADATPRSQP